MHTLYKNIVRGKQGERGIRYLVTTVMSVRYKLDDTTGDYGIVSKRVRCIA